jgi:two-component system sensor histidine kinase UhpB
LHDELAQGITAVRALAGAIAQRTAEQPALHGPAQSIVVVTGQMQDGVRNILQQLRPPAGIEGGGVDQMLHRHLERWQQHYPEIALDIALTVGATPVGDVLAQTLLRVVQEGLTNVVRHAAASRVEVRLRRLRDDQFDGLELTLRDDGGSGGSGGGLDAYPGFPGCGFGLAGMRERVAALSGELCFERRAGQGACLSVRLPLIPTTILEETS